MATSEPLVPKGLPQGSRQQVRQGMVQAGVPLDVPRGGTPRGAPGTLAPVIPGSVGDGGVLNLLSDNEPGAFPFIQERLPQQGSPPDAPDSVVSALAASAQSEFAAAVSARLAQILT